MIGKEIKKRKPDLSGVDFGTTILFVTNGRYISSPQPDHPAFSPSRNAFGKAEELQAF